MRLHSCFHHRSMLRWVAASTILWSSAPLLHAQTKVSLQPMQPAVKVSNDEMRASLNARAESPTFVPLAGPQASAAQGTRTISQSPMGVNDVVSGTHPVPPQMQKVAVKEMQRVTTVSGSPNPSLVPSELGNGQVVSSDASTAGLQLPFAQVAKFQGEARSQTSESQEPPSVERVVHGRVDGMKLFGDLRTDRKYIDSATMAEPIRQQDPGISPYLWGAHGYCWQTPALCYSPLYFEQPNLERYGQGPGRPFASTASGIRFVGQLATLPVAMVCTPPWDKSCTLGHHRPGDCAPYQRKTTDH